MPADIIILGAIAIFVLLRLRSTLGKDIRGGGITPQNNKDKIIQLIAKDVLHEEENKINDNLNKYNEDIQQGIKNIKIIDKNFSIDDFIYGAKSAFEMVQDGFEKNNLDILKQLLADGVFMAFKNALEEQKLKGKILQSTLVAILEANILDIKTSHNIAKIKVNFKSEQINLTIDKHGKVLEGDASQIDIIENIWIFEKDLKSTNPSWLIIAT